MCSICLYLKISNGEKHTSERFEGYATTRGSRSRASGTIRDFVGPGGGCTPSRRGVFLTRRTPRAEGMTGARTRRKSATRSRRLRTRFASRVAAPFHQRGDRPRLRGPSVPAARVPCPVTPSRASPRKLGERDPGAQSSRLPRVVPSRRSHTFHPLRSP